MRRAALLALLGALALAACGDEGSSSDGAGSAAPGRTTTVERTRVQVVEETGRDEGFDPAAIYKREAPGVVTVLSLFKEGGFSLLDGGDRAAAEGSGFVLSGDGEIATNAHVVTTGEGSEIKRAKSVFVDFADGNRVQARIVGFDPNADVALLRIDPAGLTLRPLPLGSSAKLVVGSPVAAIGSPFGEPQSLSVGVISALDRSIESLTSFQISGAIQTDAAINHGNSGGPLVNARGEVLGINSQIRSTGGGGEGVGFAVPIDTVKRSLRQLREKGKVSYAYIGVSTTELYPQLVERFDLPVAHGAWIQDITDGGPADRAGLRAGSRKVRFQAGEFNEGGDIITLVEGRRVTRSEDLSETLARHEPGETVTLQVYRGARKRTVKVRLGERPAGRPRGLSP